VTGFDCFATPQEYFVLVRFPPPSVISQAGLALHNNGKKN
jgi:hypothetical protein